MVSVFIFSCGENNETALDWLYKASSLWDGQKYTDPEKAIDYLSNAIELNPNHAETYNKRGIAYYNLGRYQRTIEDNSEAIRLDPDFTVAYNNRGSAYAKLGQYQKAIEDYNEAIRLEPRYAKAYQNRGFAYISQQNDKLGCQDARKACTWGECYVLEWAKGKGLCR